MKYSLAGTVELVADGVAPELVGSDAWRRIREVAARLPAALARGFYLECRLGEGAAPVDWIVRVEEAGRDVLAGRNPAVALPEPLRADPVWSRVAAFCAAWADDPLLRGVLDHLWLEFDLDDAGGEVPRPSLFAATRLAAVAGFGTAEWGVLLDRMLEHLAPEPSPAWRGALRGVLARRPAGATVPYVGFMLARPERAARVYCGRVTADTLPHGLRAMGWPGDPDELRALLRRVEGGPRDATPHIGMAHLDVAGGEVLPRVGVEYTFRRSEQLRGAFPQAPFLEHLAGLGLGSGTKHRGIAAWPGADRRTLPHELWESLLVRRVNCVKLVHHPGRPAEAKAYLLTHWIPARRWSSASTG